MRDINLVWTGGFVERLVLGHIYEQAIDLVLNWNLARVVHSRRTSPFHARALLSEQVNRSLIPAVAAIAAHVDRAQAECAVVR